MSELTDSMRQFVEERYRIAARKAEAERDADLRMLDQLEVLLRQVMASPSPPAIVHKPFDRAHLASPKDKPEGKVYGAIAGIIRDVVAGITNEFTVQDVKHFAKEQHGIEINPTTISGHLQRVTKQGKLALIHAGAGKSPSVYKNHERRTDPT